MKEYDSEHPQGVLVPKPDYQRFWIQRSRGYSKSTDIASCIMWLIFAAQRKIEGVIAAEDQEQAEFVRSQMQELFQYNQWLNNFLRLQRHNLINIHTGSEATFVTSDANSSFGAKPHFTLATEFTHWTDSKFWESIFSSAAKTFDKGGLLIIDCNAGEGSGWQWKMKQEAMASPLWYHHAPKGYAPWYSEETINEQAGGLTIQQFKRLWHNEWQASDGEFVSLEEAEKCVEPSLIERDGAIPEAWQYVAAIDYAEKTDLCVGAVGHLHDGKIIIDRMDVIHPKLTDEGIVRVDWVKQWMINVKEKFGGKHGEVVFVADPYQLIGLIQDLEALGFDITRFEFGSGRGNYELSHILLQMILHRRILWYAGCGTIYDRDGAPWSDGGGRNDLCTELAALVKKKQGTHRWRFDHIKGEHDDRAFVLGLISHFIVNNSLSDSDWGSVVPSKDGHARI